MGLTWICRENLVLRTWAEQIVGGNRIPWFPAEISQALDMDVWHTCTGIKHSENEHKLTIWVYSMGTSPQSGCIWAQTPTPTQCARTFEGGVCLSLMSRYMEHRVDTKAALFDTIGDGMLVANSSGGHHIPPYEFYSAEKEIWN